MPLPQQLDDDTAIVPAEGSTLDSWFNLIELDTGNTYGTWTVDSPSGANFEIDYSHANDPSAPYVLVTLAPADLREVAATGVQFIRYNVVESDYFKGTAVRQRLWLQAR